MTFSPHSPWSKSPIDNTSLVEVKPMVGPGLLQTDLSMHSEWSDAKEVSLRVQSWVDHCSWSTSMTFSSHSPWSKSSLVELKLVVYVGLGLLQMDMCMFSEWSDNNDINVNTIQRKYLSINVFQRTQNQQS